MSVDYTVRPGAKPLLIAPDELRRASVGAYLDALDEHVPGIEWRFDYAVVVGRLAAREIRAGRWDEHREIAIRTFDEDEFDVVALAAVSLLEPGPAPEPFESLIALAGAAHDLGMSPDDAAEVVADFLVPIDSATTETIAEP